jgi:hypothetical protein
VEKLCADGHDGRPVEPVETAARRDRATPRARPATLLGVSSGAFTAMSVVLVSLSVSRRLLRNLLSQRRDALYTESWGVKHHTGYSAVVTHVTTA